MPGTIPWSTIINTVKKVSAGGHVSVPVSGDIMDMMQLMELPEKRILTKGKDWMNNLKPQQNFKYSYDQGFTDTVKSAWIFSGPLGATDVMQAPNVPKYLWDSMHGGSKDDPKRTPWRSLGMAGLAAGGTLFGLGFAGMGMRDLGLKMSLIAKRVAKNKGLTEMEQGLAHKMDVPAYTRFGKTMGGLSTNPWISKPLSAVGTAAGAVAHPFNKIEDYLTRKIVQGVGPSAAESLGSRLHLTSQGRIFDNPAVRGASSMAALPFLVAGDAMFAPYVPANKQAAYTQGYMTKLAQYRSISEMTGEALGGGVTGTIGGAVPYFIPGVGTAASLYDTGAQVGNMFSKDKTMMERAGHGAAAVGNLGFAALNMIPLLGPAASSVIRGAVKSAPLLSKAAPAVKYLKGETGWQQKLKGLMPASPIKSVEGSKGFMDTLKGQKGNWGSIAKNYANPINLGRRTGLTLAKSPTAHMMAAMSMGGGAYGGAEGAEQQAGEGLAKGIGAGISQGVSPWQRGAIDYYRSVR